MRITLLFFLVFLSGCFEKNQYTQEECETLSFETYRGNPKSAHKLKNYCGQYKLQYTKDHCQKAFELLILNGREQDIKNKFGDRAMECFDQRQLDKFQRKN